MLSSYSRLAIASVVCLMAITFTSIAYAQNAECRFKGNLTNRKGDKLAIEEMQLIRHHHTQPMLQYMGIPTSSEMVLDSLPIFTGDYVVRIPFSVIDKISVQMVKFKRQNEFFERPHATAVLTGGALVKGEFYSGVSFSSGSLEFRGATDLGKLTLRPDDIGELRIVVKPTVRAPIEPGSKSATLYTGGTKDLQIRGAAFMKEVFNKNGTYTGDGFSTQVKVTDAGTVFDVEWGKLKSIKFRAPADWEPADERPKAVSRSVAIRTQSGKEMTADLDASGIEGVADIHGTPMRVLVPLYSKGSSILLSP